jgi:hypothetical protein
MTLEDNFKYYSLDHSVEMTDSFQMAVNHLSFIHFLEASQFELFSRYRHFVEE